MTDEKKLLETVESINSRLTALEEAQHVNASTARELLHMYENVKGFFVILAWLERVSIWIAKMAVAGGILWFLFKESVTQALRNEGGK